MHSKLWSKFLPTKRRKIKKLPNILNLISYVFLLVVSHSLYAQNTFTQIFAGESEQISEDEINSIENEELSDVTEDSANDDELDYKTTQNKKTNEDKNLNMDKASDYSNRATSSQHSHKIGLQLGSVGPWQSIYALSYAQKFDRSSQWYLGASFGQGNLNTKFEYKQKKFSLSEKTQAITIAEHYHFKRASWIWIKFLQSYIAHRGSVFSTTTVAESADNSSNNNIHFSASTLELGAEFGLNYNLHHNFQLNYTLLGISRPFWSKINHDVLKSGIEEDNSDAVSAYHKSWALWGLLNIGLNYVW